MKTKNKTYEPPEVMIEKFTLNDVVTTSIDGYTFMEEGLGEFMSWSDGF